MRRSVQIRLVGPFCEGGCVGMYFCVLMCAYVSSLFLGSVVPLHHF